MKTETCIITILLAAGLVSSRAQDSWTPKADFGGGGRLLAAGFSIKGKGYVGTGFAGIELKDLWEYDPAINAWTQKANFGGTARYGAIGFSIGDTGYIGTGADSGDGLFKDFWGYDPAANTWTQKTNFGGTGRSNAVGFSIGRKGYIGTGYDSFYDKDLWEYDPDTNTWARKADFGGTGRAFAVGFPIGKKGYIGTGFDGGNEKDFWEYDPATNAWTQKAHFGGTARSDARGLSIGSKGYIGTGYDGSYDKDFWEYDPETNTWTQKADFGGTARYDPIGFAIGGKGYVGTGYDGSDKADFWEYTPAGSVSTCLPPPAGLVSWWSGDRTAEDLQGTNPGVLKNGASFRAGKVGPAFLFDGADDAVVIPNSPSVSQTRITLDAWVYPTGKQDMPRHIISKDNELQKREYIMSLNADNKFHAAVQLPSGIKDLFGTTTGQLNTWYHVAMTHDGNTLRLYVNGSLNGTLDAVGNMVSTSNPVGIGGNALPVFFQGIIDEVQIFDRALTEAEILAIYQAGADGQCKPSIFVASIDPSYEVRRPEFSISTSVLIQDVNATGIEDATVQIATTFPDGLVLTFPVKTDQTGEATLKLSATSTGLYGFKVRKVNHPTRKYDASLNIETSDTLLIP